LLGKALPKAGVASASQEVVWTLPDHVDPATVPLAVAPGSHEAKMAEKSGRLLPSPQSLSRGGPAQQAPPAASRPDASVSAVAPGTLVPAVRYGSNAVLFAGYLVRASAGWSTFTRRYCVVDPASASLRCFQHGPSVAALAAIFGVDHPAAESEEAAQSIAPVQGDLAVSLTQVGAEGAHPPPLPL
jgi:hypothetical protein